MRVVITGARGQVGYELMRSIPDGFEVFGLGSAELDIADAAQVDEVISRLQPQLIINAAAYTAVDKAESDTARAYAVNRDGVANLARIAERLAVPLLHISTDYVFAGDATKPYRESDVTGPTGIYGQSKLEGETLLAELCSRYLILRTSWVFGVHGNNFVKTMLRLGRERDVLSVVADQQGGPTSAASIAGALWSVASSFRQSGTLLGGVYHFSGKPACSWFDFALAIFQQAVQVGLLPHAPEVNAISSEDYPTPAKRPSWSVLDCARLQAAYSIAQPDWRVELDKVLRELYLSK